MAEVKGNDRESEEKQPAPSDTRPEEDSEDDEEILEESPCGRWLKRREEVEQRDIPGIDATYLAMDTEEGVEVVWNEVNFSERKYFNARQEKISEVFDRLIQLDHPNIVKVHRYWIDKDSEKPRLIFITEYMSSGSLKQFLKKTKRNVIKMALPAWKRWCTQILSALCYLHSSHPPIIHGNLTCDTIFISHNGLIKIGAVAPEAISKHVKTFGGGSMANLHFLAPEIGSDPTLTPSSDIYAFGICSLEMAALEISGNGDSGTSQITEEVINKTIESLDNPQQKDFIRRCLEKDPRKRSTARELLFHPIIFEVPALKLLAAHVIVNTSSYQREQLTEEALSKNTNKSPDSIVAEIIHHDERGNQTFKLSDMPKRELEKFLEEVRNGVYPLTAIVTTTRPPLKSRQRTTSPEISEETVKPSNTPEGPYDEEARRVLNVMCSIKPSDRSQKDNNGGGGDAQPSTSGSAEYLALTLLLRMDDKMNRQLTCDIAPMDTPAQLAQELVRYGFINSLDKDIIATLIADTLTRGRNSLAEGEMVQTVVQNINLKQEPVPLGPTITT